MVEGQYTYAVGRRKTSVAQVRLFHDAGSVVVDDRLMEEAFPYITWQQLINEPFTVTNTQGRYRIVAKIKGGELALVLDKSDIGEKVKDAIVEAAERAD